MSLKGVEKTSEIIKKQGELESGGKVWQSNDGLKAISYKGGWGWVDQFLSLRTRKIENRPWDTILELQVSDDGSLAIEVYAWSQNSKLRVTYVEKEGKPEKTVEEEFQLPDVSSFQAMGFPGLEELPAKLELTGAAEGILELMAKGTFEPGQYLKVLEQNAIE
jgi:hypothetical protein